MPSQPSNDKPASRLPRGIWTREFLLTWASTWLIFLGFYVLLPTLPQYFIGIGGKPASAGLLIGWFTLTAMAFRPIGGRLADTRGKPWTMLVGAVLLTGTMTFYWAGHTPTSLLVLRFFHGIGWAIYLTAAVALISDIAHPTQRATLTGHYFLANTMAMVVGPWLGTVILARSNFTVLFSIAIGLTALALACIWPLHRKATPVTAHHNGRWISPKAWLTSQTIFFAAITYGGVVSFLPLCVLPKQVSLFYATYAVALGLSRPFGGYAADRFGRATVIIPCLLLLAASMAGLAWADSTAELLVVASLYGIGFGGAGPALNALTIDRVPSTERGAAMAMYAGMFEMGLALGSVVLGLVVNTADFQGMWLVAGAAPVLGMAFFASSYRRSVVKAHSACNEVGPRASA